MAESVLSMIRKDSSYGVKSTKLAKYTVKNHSIFKQGDILKSEINGRDPATFLNHVDWYIKPRDGEKTW